MTQYKRETGGDVISIPHNSNLSRGQMFKNETFDGERLSYSYLKTRAEFEPVIEVTQYKGDSETHPLISPSDDYADFERDWYDSLIGSNNDSISLKKENAKKNRMNKEWVCRTCGGVKFKSKPNNCVRAGHNVKLVRQLNSTLSKTEERTKLHDRNIDDGGLRLGAGLDWSRPYSRFS